MKVYNKITDIIGSTPLLKLTNYIEENGWTLYDTYIDDGISGTTFDRPGVQRLLEDAKAGNINLILCKDMNKRR